MRNYLLVPELREFLSKNNIKGINEFCSSAHPRIIADSLSGLECKEIWKILIVLEPSLRSEIFSHLDEDIQLELANILKREELASLISDMSPDDRVDLLKNIPEETREALFPAIAQAERDDIRKLSAYPEGTAGAIMTSEYATLYTDLTAEEAIAKLRREAPDKETIYYAYVIDDNRKLIGFVSLKNLIISSPKTRVKEIMHKDVIYARVNEDQEQAARKIQKYDLIALPVVNENDILVGIITHDDAIDVLTQEQTEDMEKLMAISGTHKVGVYLKTSAWEHFKNRGGWIVILAAFGLISGFIVQSFEGLLLQFSILASFMPMLADTGGNTGSQAATLVIRAIALREISTKDVFNVLSKELKISLLLGFLVGIIAFARVFLYSGSSNMNQGYSLIMLGIAVSAALVLQVVTSTLIGALLPLAAEKIKLDPAVVASPALTTIVDITGLFIYFSVTKLILGIG